MRIALVFAALAPTAAALSGCGMASTSARTLSRSSIVMQAPDAVLELLPGAVRRNGRLRRAAEANWDALCTCYPTTEAALEAAKLSTAVILPYGFDADNRAANIAGSFEVSGRLCPDTTPSAPLPLHWLSPDRRSRSPLPIAAPTRTQFCPPIAPHRAAATPGAERATGGRGGGT